MVERVRAHGAVSDGGSYFASPKPVESFIPSGCKTLDLALGGGWAEKRIANIIGDKSSGKTLLCIEASANFAHKYPKGNIMYRECEAAFDEPYAEAIGMPLKRIDFGGEDYFNTVEDFFDDLSDVIKTVKQPTLYILDSLDSLSDRAEMSRGIDEATFGANKAKQLSQLFRRTVRDQRAANVTIMIVSQIRENIGVSFGRKTTRSGGKALDFYASQVAYLRTVKTNTKTISGITRPVSIDVQVRMDKNKVGLPFREAEFQLVFGYGVDDTLSCLKWLRQAKKLNLIGMSNSAADRDLRAHATKLNDTSNYFENTELQRLHRVVEKEWYTIEQSFLPKRNKYGAS